MTMDATAEEVEYLSREIVKNSRPISYREFSHLLDIHLSRAKLILYEYYKKNQTTLSASFLISGISNDGCRLIQFCENEKIADEREREFKQISTIHIYCVHKKDSSFTLNDLALEGLKTRSSLDEIEKYEKNGIIIGPKLSFAQATPLSSVPASSPVVKTLEKEARKQPSSTVKSAGLSSSYVSRKQQQQQQQQQTMPEKKSALTYTSRKPSSSNTTNDKSNSIPQKRAHTEPETPVLKYQYKSRKLEAKQPRERVIVSSHNPEDEEELEEEEEAQGEESGGFEFDNEKGDGERQGIRGSFKETRPPPKTKLSDIFNDDDDDEDFEFSDDTKSQVIEEVKLEDDESRNETDKVRTNDTVETGKQEDDDGDDDKQLFVSSQEPAVTEEGEGELRNENNTQAPENANEEGDEDGDLVEELDEEGYTVVKRKPRPVTRPKYSTTSRKTSNRAAPQSLKPAGKKANDGNKKKTQSSLMSFFGKK